MLTQPVRRAPSADQQPVRCLSWPILVVAGLVLVGIQMLFLKIVFPSGSLAHVSHTTGGAIRPTLVANLCISAGVIGCVLIGFGRQRFADLGLDRGWIAAGIITLLVWLAINGLETASNSGSPTLDSAWSSRPIALVGQWFAVTFGTALQEEVLFRGVLLRQLFQRFRNGRRNVLLPLAGAIFVSQLLFAFMHLPILISSDDPSLESSLAGLFFSGCSLACLFWASRNLWLCIGVHGLADAPTLIVVDHWDLLEHQVFVNATCWTMIALCLMTQIFNRTSRQCEEKK